VQLTDHHLQNIRRLDLRAKVDAQQAVLLVQRGDCVPHDGGGVGVRVADGGAGDEGDYCYLGGGHFGPKSWCRRRSKDGGDKNSTRFLKERPYDWNELR
jgi:hypothetical protein